MKIEKTSNRGKRDASRSNATSHLLYVGCLSSIGLFLAYNSSLSATLVTKRGLIAVAGDSKQLRSDQVAKAKKHVKEKFTDAYVESMGFFDDIPNESWAMMKEHAKENNEHFYINDPLKSIEKSNVWYQMNWDPNFSCNNERRVGGMGGGGKWVCNPHRVLMTTLERVERGAEKCLVYSIGSAGKFEFELGVQELFGMETCEIHVFDPHDYSNKAPPNTNFHSWGIESKENAKTLDNFKTMSETVQELGHEGRIVDIFKIDCEECEWRTYQDWFDSGLDIRQILVETHVANRNSNDFFERLRDENYVIFHKEPNTFIKGRMQEYAFLKLDRKFFI